MGCCTRSHDREVLFISASVGLSGTKPAYTFGKTCPLHRVFNCIEFNHLVASESVVLTAQAMTDPTASSTDEKATVVHPDNKAKKGGFFSHKRHSPGDDNLEEKPAELSADVPQENDVIPISFVQLFRYLVL